MFLTVLVLVFYVSFLDFQCYLFIFLLNHLVCFCGWPHVSLKEMYEVSSSFCLFFVGFDLSVINLALFLLFLRFLIFSSISFSFFSSSSVSFSNALFSASLSPILVTSLGREHLFHSAFEFRISCFLQGVPRKGGLANAGGTTEHSPPLTPY